MPAGARVDRAGRARARGGAYLLPAAVAAKCETGVEQRPNAGGMGGGTLALPADLAVPAEAVGLQATQDLVRSTGCFAGWIDVVDAHQPFATGRQRLQVAGGGGYQGAEVQGAGG